MRLDVVNVESNVDSNDHFVVFFGYHNSYNYRTIFQVLVQHSDAKHVTHVTQYFNYRIRYIVVKVCCQRRVGSSRRKFLYLNTEQYNQVLILTERHFHDWTLILVHISECYNSVFFVQHMDQSYHYRFYFGDLCVVLKHFLFFNLRTYHIISQSKD